MLGKLLLRTSSPYLRDGVSQRADHCAPHHPQLLLVLQGLGIAADGPKHRLPEGQWGGRAGDAAGHQGLEARQKPAASSSNGQLR